MMGAFLSQFRLGLKLALRNRMALIYGFVFPLIFLFAFWALYRHDEKPLVLRLGELLTVTVLGGACFGLPTTLVSERERGVWRRYRLTPTPTWIFISSVLATRYVLILAGAVMQIAVALALGMPLPSHPFGLWVAFTCAAFAFMGLGMVIATLADNVPAVQALGQCIFLPMLIIGGVAVRLSTLPDWAMHVSAFFPGRYAVAALQANASGLDGLKGHGFDLLALLLIGGAAFFAALQTFRWDAGPVRGKAKPLVLLSFAVWALVGVLAEVQHRIAATEPVLESVGKPLDFVRPPGAAPASPSRPAGATPSVPVPSPSPAAGPAAPPTDAAATAPRPGAAPQATAPQATAPQATAPQAAASGAAAAPPAAAPAPKAVSPGAASPKAVSPKAADAPLPGANATSWREVDPADFKQVAFEALPADSGVIAPIAAASVQPDDAAIDRLRRVNDGLGVWVPGLLPDKEQAVRNMLYVAGVPDLLQMDDIEPFVPVLVYDRLRERMSDADLAKLFFWIAMHPEGGDDAAIDQMSPMGLPTGTKPRRAVRERAMIYAFKFLGWVTGQAKPVGR